MLTWDTVLHFAQKGNPQPEKRMELSDEDWKTRLSPEVYRITRKKGTEPAFSSEMCHRFEPGSYACACCGSLLFSSDNKYESGTGWPSFSQPVSEASIAYLADRSYGMYRVETICNTCDAHLGHVFPDGPPPSGLRYCMNALALTKEA